MATLNDEVLSIKRTLKEVLLPDKIEYKLIIPDYQRSYEWKDDEHVKALLDDTYEACLNDKNYNLGTIILYCNNNEYEIVDGQQRLITLSILFYLLLKDEKEKGKLTLLYQKISYDQKSIFYIKNARRKIQEYFNIKDTERYLSYIQGNKPYFNVLIIPNGQLSLAYTFFDSLNSKGKKLSDYDLLKAHHLMFIPENQENLARKHNDFWQSKDEKHKQLFERILRQIRVWARGYSEEGGNERVVYNEFVSAIELKDVERDEHVFNRYMQPNVFRSWSRENDEIVLNMRYPSRHVEDLIPMEIPQTIEGGDSFFLYAKRYHNMYQLLFENDEVKTSTAIQYVCDLSKHIINSHIQDAFKAVVLLYYDKFGENKLMEFSTCVELIVSKPRFFLRDGKTRGVRPVTSLAIRKEVQDKKLIPEILNASQVNHIYAKIKQLLPNQAVLDMDNVENGVRKKYIEEILGFYDRHKYKLSDIELKERISKVYPTLKKQSNE